jgi:phytoene synthase
VPAQPSESLEKDLLECREVIRVHSRSFYAASRLLPGRMRDAAVATYAFCRGADDDVDDAADAQDAQNRHAATRARLSIIYSGAQPQGAVGRAFAWVVHTFGIPRGEPEALLDGMQQDLTEMKVANEDELMAYCYRAAGVVGLMMSRIMGRGDGAALKRAVDLGMAMQLTNISRDVGEDARRGRIYLPLTWLTEAGSSEEEVLAGKNTPAIAATNKRLLALAEKYYESGMAGIALLPSSSRPAILAAALIYREIGMKVLAADGDGVTSRARVSGWGKLKLAIYSVVACLTQQRFRRQDVPEHTAELHASLRRLNLAP